MLNSEISIKKNQGIAAKELLKSAFFFSLMSVCVKQVGDNIPIAQLVLLRALVSLIITRYLLIKERISPWGANKLLLIIRGFVGTGALFCIFNAISSLPLSIATIIQYTYPTFTVIVSWAILREKTNKYIFLAIAIGWIGILITVNPTGFNTFDNSFPVKSIIIAIVGAILTSIAYVIVRKLSKAEHPLVIIYYFPLISIPITIPFILNDFVIPSENDWLWIIGIGLFTQLGQLSITKGLKLMSASKATSINYVQVLFATFWGIAIFGESLTSNVALGGLLVLASTLISIKSQS